MISMFFIQRCKDNNNFQMYTYMRTLIPNYMQMKKNFEKSEKKITYAMILHTTPVILQQI